MTQKIKTSIDLKSFKPITFKHIAKFFGDHGIALVKIKAVDDQLVFIETQLKFLAMDLDEDQPKGQMQIRVSDLMKDVAKLKGELK